MLRDGRSRAVLRGKSFEMKKFDVRWATLIVFTVLLSGWWYWYEYRPQKIKEECARFFVGTSAATRWRHNLEVCQDVGGWQNLMQAHEAQNTASTP